MCLFIPCLDGYIRNIDTGLCEDIDECLGEATCKRYQICTNLDGSYKCDDIKCNLGFQLNTTGECYGRCRFKYSFFFTNVCLEDLSDSFFALS